MISGKLFFLIAHSITLGSLSNAFSKSIKHIGILFSFARYFSCILCTMNRASIFPFPGTKPNCISSRLIGDRILSNTHSTIFMPCSNSFTPLRPMAHHISLSFEYWHHHTGLPFIWDSVSIQDSLTKLHHHILSNLTTCHDQFNHFRSNF